MNIGDAVRLLKEGKKVRRASWGREFHIKLISESIIVQRDGDTYTKDVTYLNNEDILADNWEEYKEKKCKFYFTFNSKSPFYDGYLEFEASNFDIAYAEFCQYPHRHLIFNEGEWKDYIRKYPHLVTRGRLGKQVLE